MLLIIRRLMLRLRLVVLAVDVPLLEIIDCMFHMLVKGFQLLVDGLQFLADRKLLFYHGLQFSIQARYIRYAVFHEEVPAFCRRYQIVDGRFSRLLLACEYALYHIGKGGRFCVGRFVFQPILQLPSRAFSWRNFWLEIAISRLMFPRSVRMPRFSICEAAAPKWMVAICSIPCRS